MSQKTAARLVAKAKHGFATPGQGPLDLRLRTAMAAFACGLVTNDFEAVAEGYCMLEDLHIAIHPEHTPFSDFIPPEGGAAPKKHPTHRPSLHFADGRVEVFETAPTGKAHGHSGYCKYCHRTHEHWWEMPKEGERALLRGYCEHVSLARFT